MITKTIVFFSVKEKLPEKEGYYMTRDCYGKISDCHWYNGWNRYNQEWDHGEHEIHSVTHWAYHTIGSDPEFEQEDTNG